MMSTEKKLVEKWKEIQRDIDAGYKFRAADRLKKLLQFYPEESFINNKLAELYYDAGFYDAAGKYWLWYPSNEYRVVRSIEIYRESMGNSATRILNDIQFNGDKSKLRNFSREIIEELEEESEEEGGFVYKEPVDIEDYYEDHFVDDTQNSGCGLVAILILALFISSLVVGFYTIISWIIQ
ncbi:MAG: hypothetical protein HWE22_09900 [Flavobacteriales bacterium]|nr:hypothetical protein [Flavobacteriales bacterium]